MAKLVLDDIPPVGVDSTLSHAVCMRLWRAINAQGLKAGDTLPGEIPIAAALLVSRPVVAAGLHELEAAGVIVRKAGYDTRLTGHGLN